MFCFAVICLFIIVALAQECKNNEDCLRKGYSGSDGLCAEDDLGRSCETSWCSTDDDCVSAFQDDGYHCVDESTCSLRCDAAMQRHNFDMHEACPDDSVCNVESGRCEPEDCTNTLQDSEEYCREKEGSEELSYCYHFTFFEGGYCTRLPCGEDKTCTDHFGDGYHCTEGECFATCSSDEQCQEDHGLDWFCMDNGVCEMYTCSNSPSDVKECPAGRNLVCEELSGKCRTDCRVDNWCSEDEVCSVQGTCDLVCERSQDYKCRLRYDYFLDDYVCNVNNRCESGSCLSSNCEEENEFSNYLWVCDRDTEFCGIQWCTNGEDCGTGYHCDGFLCRQDCDSDTNCELDEICVEGQCKWEDCFTSQDPEWCANHEWYGQHFECTEYGDDHYCSEMECESNEDCPGSNTVCDDTWGIGYCTLPCSSEGGDKYCQEYWGYEFTCGEIRCEHQNCQEKPENWCATIYDDASYQCDSEGFFCQPVSLGFTVDEQTQTSNMNRLSTEALVAICVISVFVCASLAAIVRIVRTCRKPKNKAEFIADEEQDEEVEEDREEIEMVTDDVADAHSERERSETI